MRGPDTPDRLTATPLEVSTTVPTLTGPHLPPKSGTVDSVVVLLHGIGSDGNDLIGLAPYFADRLPNTAFHAPNAPERYANAGFGYQWYPRYMLAEGDHAKRVEEAVNGFIDALLEEYDLEASRCVLAGFSQGSIVAMHVAPRRADSLAGVVAFSGGLQTGATLPKEKASSPPTLLVHGADDPVLSPEESERAAQTLNAAGVPATVHILPGLGHSIDPRGFELAIEFIKDLLDTA